MLQTVTVTSQGQITIPAYMRRTLNLNKKRKIFIFLDNGELRMRPAEDFLSLASSLAVYVKKNKNKTLGQIVDDEQKALKMANLARYKDYLKRNG